MRILWLLLVPMVAASGWDVGDTSQADILVNGESVGTAVRTVQDDHVIIDITLTASPVALQIRETYTEPGVLLRVQEFRDGEAVRATTYPDGLDRAWQIRAEHPHVESDVLRCEPALGAEDLQRQGPALAA